MRPSVSIAAIKTLVGMNDISDASKTDQPLRITSLVPFFLNCGITALIILGLQRTQTFTPVFDDFGTEIPLLTKVMISPWWIGGLVAVAVSSFVKEFLLPGKRFALIFNAIHLWMLLLVWQLHIEATTLPLRMLIKSLT